MTAQYDATKEALGADMRGDMYIARVRRVADADRPRRLDRQLSRPDFCEWCGHVQSGRHRALACAARRLQPRDRCRHELHVQGGPRVSSYGNSKPELLANFNRQIRIGQVRARLLAGRNDHHGDSRPGRHSELLTEVVVADPPQFRSRRAAPACFTSQTLYQGHARVFHPEMVGSYSPGGPYILAASYGIDFQKGDVRSEFLSDKQVVRHVLLVRLTFAPRLSRIRPADPNDPRSKGVVR